jgi:hypothetical protein
VAKTRIYLKLKNPKGEEETYSFSCPIANAHNLIFGAPYVDMCGKITITNHTTGEEANLEFHKKGWTGKMRFMVTGTINNTVGKPVYNISGNFTEQISVTHIETGVEN